MAFRPTGQGHLVWNLGGTREAPHLLRGPQPHLLPNQTFSRTWNNKTSNLINCWSSVFASFIPYPWNIFEDNLHDKVCAYSRAELSQSREPLVGSVARLSWHHCMPLHARTSLPLLGIGYANAPTSIACPARWPWCILQAVLLALPCWHVWDTAHTRPCSVVTQFWWLVTLVCL